MPTPPPRSNHAPAPPPPRDALPHQPILLFPPCPTAPHFGLGPQDTPPGPLQNLPQLYRALPLPTLLSSQSLLRPFLLARSDQHRASTMPQGATLPLGSSGTLYPDPSFRRRLEVSGGHFGRRRGGRAGGGEGRRRQIERLPCRDFPAPTLRGGGLPAGAAVLLDWWRHAST
jgi:hypothetical protein